MIISTSDTGKPVLMKRPVSSYIYKVIVISYSLQYDIIYEFMPVKRKNKHIERMCLSTCLADFTLLPHYTNPDRFSPHYTPKFYRQVSSRLSAPEGESAGEKGRYVSSWNFVFIIYNKQGVKSVRNELTSTVFIINAY